MTQDNTTPSQSEAASLKALQKDLRTVMKPLSGIAELKSGDATALDELEKLANAIPSGEQLSLALDELRTRARNIVASGRESRARTIRQIEADFINAKRANGEDLRESGEGRWRIGRVELEIDRQRARARASYNREVVVPWSPVATTGDLQSLHVAVDKKLDEAIVPIKELSAAFADAYEHLRQNAKRADTQSPRVPLKDFYREFRVALARYELLSGSQKKLARTEFPLWAFLLNLDLYRRESATWESDRRLTFETGSQHDQQKGLAMIVNGLDATQDYKSYCYVYGNRGV